MHGVLCAFFSWGSSGDSGVTGFFLLSEVGDASLEQFLESSDFLLRTKGLSDSLSETLFMSNSLSSLCSGL